MRISDWSSDVCSSDLLVHLRGIPVGPMLGLTRRPILVEDRICVPVLGPFRVSPHEGPVGLKVSLAELLHVNLALGKRLTGLCECNIGAEIGRASCRERVCKSV